MDQSNNYIPVNGAYWYYQTMKAQEEGQLVDESINSIQTGPRDLIAVCRDCSYMCLPRYNTHYNFPETVCKECYEICELKDPKIADDNFGLFICILLTTMVIFGLVFSVINWFFERR